jgi:hypothetical protein
LSLTTCVCFCGTDCVAVIADLLRNCSFQRLLRLHIAHFESAIRRHLYWIYAFSNSS